MWICSIKDTRAAKSKFCSLKVEKPAVPWDSPVFFLYSQRIKTLAMKKLLPLAILVLAFLPSCLRKGDDSLPKTTFQSSQPYRGTIDTQADAVMVYGVHNLEERLASWRERGYRTDFMTGIAWGGYRDYFHGDWDGSIHMEDGQMEASGDTIWHGRHTPYIVPSLKYLEYFKKEVLKPVIDAGVEAIYLEEPEFWARAGYSESFKKEWELYYGSPWQDQASSPEATYLSNKLKYHLYYRALEEAFSYAKEYGKSLGKDIKCYVPTHSLLNYSMWEIVSPEASLASMDCVDGYIAQVWTGTSRSPDFYRGLKRERVFETAFLEYACMISMTEPTGRDIWLLTDPIEDAVRDWKDYHRNYHATFTAQLLFPSVNRYEIMPWPARIYEREYPVAPGSKERSRIPSFYATMMGIMIDALQQMPKSSNKVDGSHGISVLMGNSLMFQGFPKHNGYDDPQMSNFFGLAMPVLKSGIPVGITHIENLAYPKSLKDTKVLLMTYSNMKPLEMDAHTALADWVNSGGEIIYVGRDDDPFQNVPEWWNSGTYAFRTPSEHLFSLLGIAPDAPEAAYPCGKGWLTVIRKDPKEFAMAENGPEQLLTAVERHFGPLEKKNYLLLERGPYDIVAVMDESVSDKPLQMEGKYIDLYDPALPVYDGIQIAPGTQKLLYNLDRRPLGAKILAQAARSFNVKSKRKSLSYTSKGPDGVLNRSRISLPKEPAQVICSSNEAKWEWDEASRTLLLEFPNAPNGVEVQIKWD